MLNASVFSDLMSINHTKMAHPFLSDLNFTSANLTSTIYAAAPDQNEMSIEKIFSIIVQCFGLILTGYLFGRLNIVTQEQSKGISAFTSRIGKKCLLSILMKQLPL